MRGIRAQGSTSSHRKKAKLCADGSPEARFQLGGAAGPCPARARFPGRFPLGPSRRQRPGGGGAAGLPGAPTASRPRRSAVRSALHLRAARTRPGAPARPRTWPRAPARPPRPAQGGPGTWAPRAESAPRGAARGNRLLRRLARCNATWVVSPGPSPPGPRPVPAPAAPAGPGGWLRAWGLGGAAAGGPFPTPRPAARGRLPHRRARPPPALGGPELLPARREGAASPAPQ